MNYNILKSEISKEKYKHLVDSCNYQEIADIINKCELIDNPIQQGIVPKKLTLSLIFAEIAKTMPSDVLKLGEIAGWVIDGTKAAIDSNNREEMANYLAICSNKLSVESKTKLQSLLLETEPDPSYQVQVAGQSRAQVLGLGWVQASDVQRVLQ